MKFIKSVIEEMKKVSWPTKKQLRKFTLIVLETSAIFAILFWIFDTGLGKLFQAILSAKF